jgi:hypothetical protein
MAATALASMRAFLLVALAPILVLAGCLESNVASTDTRDDGVHSSSVSCNNGDCEVCADGQCAPCEKSACDECRDGECPEFGRAAGAVAGAPEDVDIQETHDLSLGLDDTTWSFDVAPQATGHVHLLLRDLATGQTEVMGSACVSYEIDGPGLHSKGSTGSCSNGSNIGVSGSTNGSPQYIVRWDELDVAHYSITASAGQQANELVVDIVVDNP